jgi:hypothetical protein
MKMSSCPKFYKCNAPICPLDKDWRKRTNLVDDATCYYLIESVKSNAKTHFQLAQLEEFYEVMVGIRGAIEKHFKRIASKLARAEKSSSRMNRVFKNNKEIL